MGRCFFGVRIPPRSFEHCRQRQGREKPSDPEQSDALDLHDANVKRCVVVRRIGVGVSRVELCDVEGPVNKERADRDVGGIDSLVTTST